MEAFSSSDDDSSTIYCQGSSGSYGDHIAALRGENASTQATTSGRSLTKKPRATTTTTEKLAVDVLAELRRLRYVA